ncbi:hypothetical protein F2Q68_00003891 [Brassica cretica]|uniref:Uncharacterized protein n=1 Tax=Brassica cretica TaxID=69181 RepID=A0A8S9J5U4_BRACR|nr:hypothetical protein F2Q68_00003891 [Brassica cretica]
MNPQKFSRNISSEYTEGLLPRNIPRDSFLGIFRGLRSSEIPDENSEENSEEHFVGTSEDWTIGKSIEISRGSSPSVYSDELSDELVVLGVSSEIRFLGFSSEISEGFPRKNEFPKSYFRGLVSSCSNSGFNTIEHIGRLLLFNDFLSVQRFKEFSASNTFSTEDEPYKVLSNLACIRECVWTAGD